MALMSDMGATGAMIPRRYIIPIAVFLIARAIIWGFEIKHRRDVANVFKTAKENGWPVVLIADEDDESDYAMRLYTMDGNASGVALAPGLKGYTYGFFQADGSIVYCAVYPEISLLRIMPPHFSPQPILHHALQHDEFSFFQIPHQLNNGSIETRLYPDHVLVNDLVTGETTEFDFSRFPEWTGDGFTIDAFFKCALSPDAQTLVVQRRIGRDATDSNQVYELWECDLEASTMRKVLSTRNIALRSVGWEGKFACIRRDDTREFCLVLARNGDQICSFSEAAIAGRRWVAMRASDQVIDIYYIAGGFGHRSIATESFGQREFSGELSIFEP